ncbi:3'-5' exonuclease-like [Lotus japonicus]|uniref:3'-5' exonuclease-like n=1 Tax=Lotus japonicus TaxID=34305 RepID=UPI002589B0C4|nr:3'-5' exonuclease-like [Lotus japonicus]
MPIFLSEPHYDPNVTVVDYRITNDNYNIYDIYFHHHRIHTDVTFEPSYVDSWISKTLRDHPHRPLTIGLDVEWRATFGRPIDNRIATLQLSVSDTCLVFQILHVPSIPNSLTSFLANPNHTFVGAGIGDDRDGPTLLAYGANDPTYMLYFYCLKFLCAYCLHDIKFLDPSLSGDVDKLRDHYSLHVASFVDLRDLAADVMGDREMRSASLKTLAMRVMGKELVKPRRITLGAWDRRWLDVEQVQYAAVDAYVSFEIGRRLYSDDL